ncbi:MAG: glycoside hydrolase family 127 protein [Candidatus Limiplasma sp.]|nr:glycoside hydrolase family 127 protein [Candidatus Limiplasma sp.]
MPTYDAFCRTPLVDPAYVALPDSAVHLEGALERLVQQALELVDLNALTPLDAVLATKLGGYTDLPPMPGLTSAAAALPENPRAFMDAVRAGLMIASAAKNKNAMTQVLTAMRAFLDALPNLNEFQLMPVGADALRTALELYRRTGQKFLLTLMERLRAQLPDVSGMFHSFPFQKPFVPEPLAEDAADLNAQYHRRMAMLGQGTLSADALSISSALAMFSGSARDASASKAGVAALQRFHGMPHGAFSADPYLAGRDPARGVTVEAVCAQLEALADLLAASGEGAYAERMERIAVNALANVFQGGLVCPDQTVNRLAGTPACAAERPAPEVVSALLRAMHALRRSVWMLHSDRELAMLIFSEGCCLARMDGVPVRLNVTVAAPGTFTIAVEAKQPVEFTLALYIPGYADSATLSVNGAKAQAVDCGALERVKRTYRSGDTLTVTLDCRPFVETGYRGSACVYSGAQLMALPLPDADAAWQYALDADTGLALAWENGRPRVQVEACAADGWEQRGGVPMPPPQGLAMGVAYELTLLPYADTLGRIAMFPQATART